MQKKYIAIIAIAAVVVALLVTVKPSAHWTREEKSETTDFTAMSGVPESGKSAIMPANIAIVAMNGPIECKGFQDDLARLIIDKVSEKQIACNFSAKYSSVSYSSPTVTAYHSLKDAKKAGCESIVLIDVQKWHSDFWPFSKRWQAKVKISVGPEQVIKYKPARMSGDCNMSVYMMDYDGQGKITGIFTGRHLRYTVADSIAKSLADNVEEYVQSNAEELLKQNKNTDKVKVDET
jgi:hypothetical protein